MIDTMSIPVSSKYCHNLETQWIKLRNMLPQKYNLYFYKFTIASVLHLALISFYV